MSPEPPRRLPPRRRRRRPTIGALWADWGSLLLFAALLGASLYLARRPALSVRLILDGAPRLVSTQVGSVAALLAEVGIAAGAHDRVSPPPDRRLTHGLRLVVEHARPVRVTVDGATRTVYSLGRTPRAVLESAGLPLASKDRVQWNGREWAPDRGLGLRPRVVQLAGGPGRSVSALDEAPVAPTAMAPETAALVDPADVASGYALGAAAEGPQLWQLTVQRALPVTIVEDDVPYPTELAGATVGEALAAAGMPLGPDDIVSPGADAPLVAGMTLQLKRGTPFTLVVDGSIRSVRANADTVGEALPRLGIAVGPEDFTDPPAESALTAGLEVILVRVRTEVVTEEVEVPYGHQEVEDPETELDTTVIAQAGVPGRKSVTSRLRYENGREAGRQVLGEELLQAPVDEVARLGTKVVWRTVDTPAGPVRYWRQLRVYATSYSLSRSGTPKSAPWYGFTRGGHRMRKGIVAVDTGVIPMGTNLYVPSYGVGLAGDTGGGVRGFHIDLGYDDDNYESWHSYTEVYLLEPLPPVSTIRRLRRQ